MMRRDRILQIKSFDDFDTVQGEMVENIRFSERKLMLHKMALTYLLHPSRIFDSLIEGATSKLMDSLWGWLHSTLTKRN